MASMNPGCDRALCRRFLSFTVTRRCAGHVEVRGRCTGACGDGGGSASGSPHVGCKETGGSWGGAEASQEGPWFLGSHIETISGEREGKEAHQEPQGEGSGVTPGFHCENQVRR